MSDKSYDGPERRRGGNAPLIIALAALLFSLVIGVSANVVQAISLSRVKANTNAIREAGYENCVRGNGPIAELQFRATLTPPETVKALVRQLHIDPRIADQTSIGALQKRLPIFDCAPLLQNKAARVMSSPEQQRYVDDFARGNVPLPAP